MKPCVVLFIELTFKICIGYFEQSKEYLEFTIMLVLFNNFLGKEGVKQEFWINRFFYKNFILYGTLQEVIFLFQPMHVSILYSTYSEYFLLIKCLLLPLQRSVLTRSPSPWSRH